MASLDILDRVCNAVKARAAMAAQGDNTPLEFVLTTAKEAANAAALARLGGCDAVVFNTTVSIR